MKTREAMINYLVKETRYTETELNKLDDKTIRRWYKEERLCNRFQ